MKFNTFLSKACHINIEIPVARLFPSLNLAWKLTSTQILKKYFNNKNALDYELRLSFWYIKKKMKTPHDIHETFFIIENVEENCSVKA